MFDYEYLERGLRFDRKIYNKLESYSKKGEVGIREWNTWRDSNYDKDLYLEGADFSKKDEERSWYLEGVNLNGGVYEDKNGKLVRQGNTYLKGAQFYKANMRNAKLHDAHLEKALFYHTDMQGAVFQGAYVDNYTTFWKCNIGRQTNFRGAALDTVIIDPERKTLLEYNIRRRNWEYWYEDKNEPIREGTFIFSNKRRRLTTNRVLKCLVRKFWEISDYGISTWRIIKTLVCSLDGFCDYILSFRGN